MDYRVIKENDVFLLTDEKGNIPENHSYGAGLYTKDTRFLSKLDLRINGEEPILLNSEAQNAYMASILLTNPHMEKDGDLILWRESVELERKRFIANDVVYEKIRAKNYFPKPVTFTVNLHFDCDFQDMFVVRGFQHGDVGKRTGQSVTDNEMRFHYEGADEIQRTTLISWDQTAQTVSDEGYLDFTCTLGHEESQEIVLTIAPILNGEEPTILPFDVALEQVKESYRAWNEGVTKVKTDHPRLQRLLDQGITDLRVLLTDLGYGSFPVAGLPWFAVPFGRDSLIAALQMLPFQPEVAKGTIRTMAAYQGTKRDPWRDEEPGKIMHELRSGELANTKQVPFSPYYGTIDATPLYLMLIVEYVKWTGDTTLLEELDSSIEAALRWIDKFGDRDGDGFVEYYQEAAKGIANQGWKDSGDSIVHRNGDYAKTPIALAEVQGYVYQAKTGLAELYEGLNRIDLARKLSEEAQQLSERFEQAFWMEDVGFYAIALDQEKKQVGTITSNPGHLLFSNMLSKERAKQVSDQLVSNKLFSGYGIRTMAEGEAGYNPMSYHDGSVWPHDNSIILLGMGRLGHHEQANRVINGLIDSASSFEYDRLPELFCGYEKGERAVKYPVACSPQAWAAGTPLVFIQTILGLEPNVPKGKIFFSPSLPDGMKELTVENMKVGKGTISLTLKKKGQQTQLDVMSNTTGLDVQCASVISQG
ncbi:amylo-alpha-1,6-glucosidase [Halalkalibacterium halodurans]|jgi:glycogen debranching enzyme|uniref:amylo-alpha-1,6-glucosidase n=1 Tax=Halalkalibacterium halodurans TaxID=86665 RepID=UPI001067575B|nr:amylo-alpha-1,6-glucosidase [Halalkalibacterium halodurans]MED4082005.1 amylo-alpha-1,6-glucosidase [Halalkalibacterium halodurans]MED4083613.1 amylo-alpha-1,6-glucosidase [Halalkalibacterium halodurans]MED4106633.1 amylo-alpha-1,6-glucosidase [Halalkalibacterium halodurans]MED4107895.1 amylo-alpha-1,6-glucosidase [Halalkalibacterium halodurans]MED4122989.1 amylo-alpha-1,6-glucosidase [Halalkalibacterium halodurans]